MCGVLKNAEHKKNPHKCPKLFTNRLQIAAIDRQKAAHSSEEEGNGGFAKLFDRNVWQEFVFNLAV